MRNKKQTEADDIIAELRSGKNITKNTSKKEKSSKKEPEKSVVFKEDPIETPKRIEVNQPVVNMKVNEVSLEEQLVIKDKRLKHFQSITDGALYNVYISGGGKFIETDPKKSMTLKVFRGSSVKFGQLFGKLILGNITFFMVKHDHKDSDTSEILFEPKDIIENYNAILRNSKV